MKWCEAAECRPAVHLVGAERGCALGTITRRVDYQITPVGDAALLSYGATWKPRTVLLHILSPLISAASNRNSRLMMRRLSDLTDVDAPDRG